MPATVAVTVIICTFNRPHLLPRAVASVLAQDDSDFEVIIVDDGSDVPVDIAEYSDDRIRLVRIPHGGVGTARKAGFDAAQGEYVAYCDDDDEWTTDHLRLLRQQLDTQPYVNLVYADSLWIEPGKEPHVPYSFEFDPIALVTFDFIFATDVMHRAGAARDVGGFDASYAAHEDWELWLRMARVAAPLHVPLVLSRHHWHEGTISARGTWRETERVIRSNVSLMSDSSIDALRKRFVEQRAGNRAAVRFDAGTWTPGRRELLWDTTDNPLISWGLVSRRLRDAMERHGVRTLDVPAKSGAHASASTHSPDDPRSRLCLHYTLHTRPSELGCERVAVYAMWESTAVPSQHIDEINRTATMLLVPCRQNVDAFRDSGASVPIRVVPHGVDSSEFPFLERPDRELFTFGSFGESSLRKGVDVLLRAFQDEFAPHEPVRLVMKSRLSDFVIGSDDPRVSLVRASMPQPALLEFLRGMDAFVLPSRGEGFGLCGLEAMATGLPLIATNWSGPADYLDDADSFALPYKLVDANGTVAHLTRYQGQWAEPDYEALRARMRWLFEHRAEARAKGAAASARVHAHWTWERAASHLCECLDTIAAN